MSVTLVAAFFRRTLALTDPPEVAVSLQSGGTAAGVPVGFEPGRPEADGLVWLADPVGGPDAVLRVGEVVAVRVLATPGSAAQVGPQPSPPDVTRPVV